MTISVNVYAESTPNPAAMKFVCSMILLPEGTVEYNHVDETASSPLAKQLFSFSGVKSVFIASNFVTVTKVGEIDWFEITGIIREFIRGFLMTGEKVFISNPFTSVNESGTPVVKTNGKAPSIDQQNIEEQIMKMLDEYVKPAVEQDGGAIQFRSFHDGVVTVVLKGSCSGCPSSTLTLKSGIENLLKQTIPQVTEVVAAAE